MSDNAHSDCRATGGIGLVTVILALVFLFVWPGPFRYEYRDVPGYTLGNTYHHPILAGTRVDRMSGDIWDYKAGKWVKR